MKSAKFTFFLFALLVLTSCGVGEAENIADEFHRKLDGGEYNFIVQNMIDSEALAVAGKEDWVELFEIIEKTWGKPTTREQEMGFKSKIDNGVTRVQLDYKISYPSTTVYERIFLADSGKGFKITGVFFNENKAKLIRQAGELY